MTSFHFLESMTCYLYKSMFFEFIELDGALPVCVQMKVAVVPRAMPCNKRDNK